MKTGRVEYAPGYKSDITTRGTCIHGTNLMERCAQCAADGQTTVRLKTVTESTTERSRLERAVIKAAKDWHQHDKGFTRIALHQAIDALTEFDSKQK